MTLAESIGQIWNSKLTAVWEPSSDFSYFYSFLKWWSILNIQRCISWFDFANNRTICPPCNCPSLSNMLGFYHRFFQSKSIRNAVDNPCASLVKFSVLLPPQRWPLTSILSHHRVIEYIQKQFVRLLQNVY